MAAALSYYRKVSTTAKGRWFGKKLKTVSDEFGYGSKLIGNPDHVVKNFDIIEYSIHVHEPAVPDINIPESILFENEEFVVINKPSGIPVHPTVNYYHNTVTEMLKSHFGVLYPCYRLDRLTSGILILAKTSEFASKFRFFDKSKVYLARVNSRNVPESLHQTPLRITDPIVTYNAKRGYERFLMSLKNAKSAATYVELMSGGSQNDLTTLKVVPITGRTHQIRKHLALHGMPIHNDELYPDNGLFKALNEEPSKQNFDAVWEYAENLRRAKLTGEVCEKCGAPEYKRNESRLDLHCFQYAFQNFAFEAPALF